MLACFSFACEPAHSALASCAGRLRAAGSPALAPPGAAQAAGCGSRPSKSVVRTGYTTGTQHACLPFSPLGPGGRGSPSACSGQLEGQPGVVRVPRTWERRAEAALGGQRLWVGAALASRPCSPQLWLGRSSWELLSPRVLFLFQLPFLGRFGLVSIFKYIHYYFN